MIRQFEFIVYPNEGNSNSIRETESLVSESAARSRAGRIAKRHNGPCDLAFKDGGDWADRYITTASPSEYHKSGYRFERLDG